MRYYGLDFFKNGQFIGLDRTQKLLQARFANFGGNRIKSLEKIFGGEEAAKAAEAFIKSRDSIKSMNDQAARGLGIQEKNAQLSSSMAESYKSAVNSLRLAASTPFKPFTQVFARGAQHVSAATAKVSDFMEKNEAASIALGTTIASGFGIAAVLGAVKLGKAAIGFGNVLRGAAGTLPGVMQGKALEKAAGVQPVFIVNWPTGFGAAGMAASAAGGGLVDKLGKPIVNAGKRVLPWAAGGLGFLGTSVAAAPVLATAALSGAALYGGYQLGKYAVNPLMAQAGQAWNEWREKPLAGEPFASAPQVQNDINMAVYLDKDGNVKGTVVDGRNTVITAKRGAQGD
ncbi:MAG TPA: hypothetical protein PLL10_02000, partial [Elusimicrobiales bacterium]|nr:hypothetical protein [Elusimicrobiales bacterium]